MEKDVKNCDNCSGRFKDGCGLINSFKIDLELEAQCKLLEQGVFEAIIQEEIDLTHLFNYMQESGIIKKSAKIKDLKQDDNILIRITEAVSDCLWMAIKRQIGSLKPEIKINKDSEFYCSFWR